ncbi:MAG TPA: 3-hydroxyacyl-CoA dehydrogenase NAD-binding domain-containing protein [Polyangiaceae bacterium]|nr:3-hydroxyacyl-CoA dehydrogenase NAD-binding domain-containing protein [Polyangiaceae bacterium]
MIEGYASATVIGGGVIGASWAALFLANGLAVCICDPAPDIASRVRAQLDTALPDLEALGKSSVDRANLPISFERDLAKAVRGADVIQENGPEKLDFKRAIWAEVERAAKPDALFLSSSSGIPATAQAAQMKHPERLVIGHPFTPPHILPLVEVVPGVQRDPAIVARVVGFYEALGKTVIVLRKEIPSFVGNRLQSALFREAMYLVREGVVTVDELDRVVTASIGIRWAVAGPFQSFHLGGGPGGLRHFVETLGLSMEKVWPHLGTASFDEPTKKLMIEQADASFAKRSYADLTSARDEAEIALVKILSERDPS